MLIGPLGEVLATTENPPPTGQADRDFLLIHTKEKADQLLIGKARRQNSLGLELADDMARQIGGSLHIGDGPEAVFTMDFKAEVPTPLKINITGATA